MKKGSHSGAVIIPSMSDLCANLAALEGFRRELSISDFTEHTLSLGPRYTAVLGGGGGAVHSFATHDWMLVGFPQGLDFSSENLRGKMALFTALGCAACPSCRLSYKSSSDGLFPTFPKPPPPQMARALGSDKTASLEQIHSRPCSPRPPALIIPF